MNLKEAPTIEELRIGAAPAWSWFVNEFGVPVSQYARRLGHPDPDEVSGATFETIVRRIDRFDGGQPELRTFVFSVAHARIVDELRSSYRQRMRIVPDVPEQIEENHSVAPLMFGAEIGAALVHLSDKQQHLIRLRYIDGLSTREVAERVGDTEGVTRVALSRGLHKLREALVRQGHKHAD